MRVLPPNPSWLVAALVAAGLSTAAAPAVAQRGTGEAGTTATTPAGDDSSATDGDAEDPDTACDSRPTSGTNCQPGNGRRAPGGGDKVSHEGWPAVTGILWIAEGGAARTYRGTALNDELLSHHKSDVVQGMGGDDILWGDWDPRGNTTSQVDRLEGGDGDDWIYASHGRNTLSGGAGKDFIYAYYGKGTIDCGPGGQDTAKIRLGTGQYKVKGCERILNFCAFGSINGKRCAKPGEKKTARTSR